MKTTLMNNVKKATVTAVLGTALFVGTATADAADMSRGANNFYTSEKVNVETVKFNNMHGMEIVGTLFTPKQMDNGKKYPALVVGHPFAAVRQQAANLYATKMAEAGFVTLSFDQMFWGESGGSPRGPCCRTSMWKASVRLWTIWEHDPLLTGKKSASSAFAAAADLLLRRPRLTRASRRWPLSACTTWASISARG